MVGYLVGMSFSYRLGLDVPSASRSIVARTPRKYPVSIGIIARGQTYGEEEGSLVVVRLDAIGILGHGCGVVGYCWKVLSIEVL